MKKNAPVDIIFWDSRVLAFGVFVREYRGRHEIPLKTFASGLGVSPRTVEGWEQGRRPGRAALALVKRIYLGEGGT